MMIFEVSKLSPDTLFDDGAYLHQFWSYMSEKAETRYNGL